MEAVIDSPAIHFETEDAVSLEHTPFAVRLRDYLDRNGVAIQFKPALEGEKIDGSFTQLNMRRDVPEGVGEVIVERFGKSVTFGEVPVPHQDGTWEYTSFAHARNVGVRHLVMRDSFDGQLKQRWDVFVKKTDPNG